jgi:Casein kinase substrate phosphoprotein PP28
MCTVLWLRLAVLTCVIALLSVLVLLLLLQEREVLEAERKKEHYLKLHAAGKTDEARADMERLAIVKARRAEQAKVLSLHIACFTLVNASQHCAACML